MAKHKDREGSQDLFHNLELIAARSNRSSMPAGGELAQGHVPEAQAAGELRKMKKFRFQLLHRWLIEHFEPCRVADVAGGKGLLAYLLQQSGWDAAVIDPDPRLLTDKYKDIATGKRVKLAATESVPHIDRPFAREMARHFDLLVGMHAHGCNVAIIDAAAEFGCGFVLFPCCVIGEPFYPPVGVHWLESLAGYASGKGQAVTPFRLNFKGQNIGLYNRGNSRSRDVFYYAGGSGETAGMLW